MLHEGHRAWGEGNREHRDWCALWRRVDEGATLQTGVEREEKVAGSRAILSVVLASLVMTVALGRAQSAEPVDLDAITRIKAEGFERSQVMDMAWWLTEVHGPRLTNSPQMRAAADWTVKKLTEWGLANVKQEPWGDARSAAAGATSAPSCTW